jgi:hypothetical protein
MEARSVRRISLSVINEALYTKGIEYGLRNDNCDLVGNNSNSRLQHTLGERTLIDVTGLSLCS